MFHKVKVTLYEWSHSNYPWLTQQANLILSTLLKPTDMGLEWGSGRSTIWFTQRVKYLTSVEHDEAWYKKVSSKLKANNILNVNYILCKAAEGQEKPEESSYVQVVNTFSEDTLNFVLIDGLYRDVCSNMVLEKIRPGGILIVDNANWYLPHDSTSPDSRPKNSGPSSEEWGHFLDRVKNWRLIWTSNGVWDTAIWFKG
ncbi:hypothetical protein ES703_27512 [subsurface metagenome]